MTHPKDILTREELSGIFEFIRNASSGDLNYRFWRKLIDKAEDLALAGLDAREEVEKRRGNAASRSTRRPRHKGRMR